MPRAVVELLGQVRESNYVQNEESISKQLKSPENDEVHSSFMSVVVLSEALFSHSIESVY
jgi:hypothetical protein